MTKKYNVLLEKELEKKEVQEGLIEACDVIDLIIAILRGSRNMKDAKDCLMTGDIRKISGSGRLDFEEDAKKLHFTERQATAILEMRLYRLIGLEILALQKAYKETLKQIREYRHILSSQKHMDQVIKEDLDAIKNEFALPRKTVLENSEAIVLEEKKDSSKGNRLRHGPVRLLQTAGDHLYERNQDAVQAEHVWAIPVMTNDRLCLFSDSGAMYQVKAADLPSLKTKDKGIPLDNVSRFDGIRERILFILPASALEGKKFLFATEQAMIKVVAGEEFVTANRMVAATKLAEGDRLACVREPEGEELVLLTAEGMVLKFLLSEVPELKKNSRGVRGMKLENGDKLEQVYFPEKEKTAEYKGKEITLGRLKLAKRDGKGTKVRLDR